MARTYGLVLECMDWSEKRNAVAPVVTSILIFYKLVVHDGCTHGISVKSLTMLFTHMVDFPHWGSS